MKIISWNIRVTNKKYSRITAHIFKQNADVICLQEVSHKVLNYLKDKNKGYNIHSTISAIGKTEKSNIYNVILSKYEILEKGHFHTSMFDINTLWKSLVKLFYRIDDFFYSGQYIDIKLKKKVRIVNIHLESYTSPKIRLSQFKEALKYYDDKKTTILCGDFNSYATWYTNWLTIFLMKTRPKDLFYNEKKKFHEIFEARGLNNIFKGSLTVKLFLFRKQVDYILLPHNFKVLDKHVFKNYNGSDHRMISAEIKV